MFCCITILIIIIDFTLHSYIISKWHRWKYIYKPTPNLTETKKFRDTFCTQPTFIHGINKYLAWAFRFKCTCHLLNIITTQADPRCVFSLLVKSLPLSSYTCHKARENHHPIDKPKISLNFINSNNRRHSLKQKFSRSSDRRALPKDTPELSCYCFAWIPIGCLRASVCWPCVETELTATKKSATDGNLLVATLCRHKRAYDRIQLVADSCWQSCMFNFYDQ